MKRNSSVQEGEPRVQTSPRGASTSQAEVGREGGSRGPSKVGEEAAGHARPCRALLKAHLKDFDHHLF